MENGNAQVRLDVEEDGVALITIYNPPANLLSVSVFAGLMEKYKEAIEREDVKAIVFTGANGKFCGGLEISIMQNVQKSGDVSLLNVNLDIVSTIEDGKKACVAALQGYALGGGLEFAMGCNARIATPGTQLGLPELSLGVIPGSGGTQRLPRLVGLAKGVEMLLTSKSVTAEEGKMLGLIDEIASPDQLLKDARLWALDIAENRKPRIRTLEYNHKLGSTDEAKQILDNARHQTTQTAPHMPQNTACIDVVEAGIVSGGKFGVLEEDRVFKELVLSSSAKSLVHLFLSERATSKVRGVTDLGLKARKVKKVGIIGGGLMGSGIATAFIIANIPVLLKDISPAYLHKGINKIQANLQSLVTKGELEMHRVERSIANVKGVLDYSEFKDVDMVIEAVNEDESLKQSIFEEIEKICPSHCVFASGTSGIDLNVIGKNTVSQDRIAGAHFFSPAHVMPLLEIVRTEKTSPQAILDLMTVGKIIKKVPVVVKNCIGFAVNRNLFPYVQATYFLADLGVDIFRIDKVLTAFGMPMGPFLLHDITGYGLAMSFEKEIAEAFPDRVYRSPLLDIMLKNGRQGKANGKGYYIFEKGSKPRPDPSVQSLIDESRRTANIVPFGKSVPVTDQEIMEMIFFPMVNESCRVIVEGIVAQASDLDIASVQGLKFPFHLGGIIFWADTIGADYIYKTLKKLSDAYGSFFKPSEFLEERADKGIPLGAPIH